MGSQVTFEERSLAVLDPTDVSNLDLYALQIRALAGLFSLAFSIAVFIGGY